MTFEAKIISIDKTFLFIDTGSKQYKINKKHLQTKRSPLKGDIVMITGGFATLDANEIILEGNSKLIAFKPEYILISEMPMNVYCNIYGIVSALLPPIKSKGTDFVTTVRLFDESGCVDVKMFTKTDIFKDFFELGDVVRIRRVKLFAENKAILSGKGVEVLDNLGAEPKNRQKKNLTAVEKIRVGELGEFYKSAKFCKRSNSTDKSNSIGKYKGLCKIRDLEEGDFFDFQGFLINIKKENDVLSILTFIDYTTNDFISPRVSYGQYYNDMILYVRVWDQNAPKVLNLEEKTFYLVKHLKVKDITNVIRSDLLNYKEYFVKKIEPNNLGSDTLYLKKEFERSMQISSSLIESQYSKYMPDIYHKLSLSYLTDIQEGINKVKIKILGHRPFRGIKIRFCMHCKKIINFCEYQIETGQKTCPLCNSRNMVFEQFVANLMVTDNTENIFVLVKNNLLEKILDDVNIIRKTPFFALILSVKKNGKLFHHLLDAVINKPQKE